MNKRHNRWFSSRNFQMFPACKQVDMENKAMLIYTSLDVIQVRDDMSILRKIIQRKSFLRNYRTQSLDKRSDGDTS